MSKKKETRGRKKGKFFVENDELVHEIKIFYETGVFTEQLGRLIKKIVDGIKNMPNYVNYFKEGNPWGPEMYSDAIYRITKSVLDGTCKIIDDEEIGDIKKDDSGKVVYKMEYDEDKDEECFVLDEDGNKIPEIVDQNNIFGYFTRTAWNAFNGRLKKEKKDVLKLDEYKQKIYDDYELEYGIIHQEEGEYKTENDW